MLPAKVSCPWVGWLGGRRLGASIIWGASCLTAEARCAQPASHAAEVEQRSDLGLAHPPGLGHQAEQARQQHDEEAVAVGSWSLVPCPRPAHRQVEQGQLWMGYITQLAGRPAGSPTEPCLC